MKTTNTSTNNHKKNNKEVKEEEIVIDESLYTRVIEISQEEIATLLREKGGVVLKGRELQKQIEQLIEDQDQLAERVKTIENQCSFLLKDVVEKELGTYEVIGSFELKDKKVSVKINDLIRKREEYLKEFFRRNGK